MNVIKKHGQLPVMQSIDATIRDLKHEGCERSEIKATIREWFYGIDGKIDKFIESKGL